MPYRCAARASIAVNRGSPRDVTSRLGSSRKRAPCGMAVGERTLPSDRRAGNAHTAYRDLGIAIASAWFIFPRARSACVIMPPASGRLVAVAPGWMPLGSSRTPGSVTSDSSAPPPLSRPTTARSSGAEELPHGVGGRLPSTRCRSGPRGRLRAVRNRNAFGEHRADPATERNARPRQRHRNPSLRGRHGVHRRTELGRVDGWTEAAVVPSANIRDELGYQRRRQLVLAGVVRDGCGPDRGQAEEPPTSRRNWR